MATIGERRDKGKKLTILGYGAPMAGKTTFIKSIRKVFKGPCYIFNFDLEDNLMPLITDPASKDIEYDQYNHEKGYDELVKKLVTLRRSCPYEVIVLENLNRMYRHIMQTVLRLASRTEDDGPRQNDWGSCNKKVYDRVKELIETPGPSVIYVTTHESLEKDETTGKMEGQIYIPGQQLLKELPPMFNLAFHFRTSNKANDLPERWIQCATDNLWPAGDKFAALAFKEPADFVKIWEKLSPLLPREPKPAATAPTDLVNKPAVI
jgi:hypothetical protein